MSLMAGNHVIRKITRDGVVSTVIGIAGVKDMWMVLPEDALFQYPTGVAIDKEGTIYVGEQGIIVFVSWL